MRFAKMIFRFGLLRVAHDLARQPQSRRPSSMRQKWGIVSGLFSLGGEVGTRGRVLVFRMARAVVG
jgi:hypothetical protein